MKNVVWIASYPKSGNTWFRVFLTNYLRDGDVPAKINALDSMPIASARTLFDDALGYDSGELTNDEIDLLRPEVYAYEAGQAETTTFRKVHDAWTVLPDGRPLFPPEISLGAIYLVRDPRDVCVSFAHHGGHGDFDRTIREMADMAHCFAESDRREPNQLRQRLLSWSGHVRSWLDQAQIPVHLVRYEDLLRSPEPTFAAAVKFAGLALDPDRLRRAIDFSRFDVLRDQEAREGFRERARGPHFFRRGEAEAWCTELTEAQAQRLAADHEDVMRRFGYPVSPFGCGSD